MFHCKKWIRKCFARIMVDTFILSTCKATSQGSFDLSQTKYVTTIKTWQLRARRVQVAEGIVEITTQNESNKKFRAPFSGVRLIIKIWCKCRKTAKIIIPYSLFVTYSWKRTPYVNDAITSMFWGNLFLINMYRWYSLNAILVFLSSSRF